MKGEILSRRVITDRIIDFEVYAPTIAKSCRAGHFVIVRIAAGGERIPLTIVESDVCRGTIRLIVQAVGATTTRMCAMQEGEVLATIVGPLGEKSDIRHYGTVVAVGGGLGIAPMLPIIKALKSCGNRVVSILGGRTKELVILEDAVRAWSDEVVVMTDDGSYGGHGWVTVALEEVLQRETVDHCYAIGPAVMMKNCCVVTKRYGVATTVSLNTLMVDGTGMCGACRVTVDGKLRFVCIDGPEFDGHAVDFTEMLQRLGTFRSQEQAALSSLSAPVTRDTTTVSTPQRRYRLSEDTCFSRQLATIRDRNTYYRKYLRGLLTGRARMVIPRVTMPELDAHYRVEHYTEEVNQGLTYAMARQEAHRCIDCVHPTCVAACPVNVDIPAFVKRIEGGDLPRAIDTLASNGMLFAVCGRVCPQERQCESACIRGRNGGSPVAIGWLERYVSDVWLGSDYAVNMTVLPKNGHKIAVVGSGPAGLSCATVLARAGFRVTVYEALHACGGVLRYGIPAFRLPKTIVDGVITELQHMGVTFITDSVFGKDITIATLQAEGYEALFIGTGAGLPRFMGIPGENAVGVLSANEYLTRVNLMRADVDSSATPMLKGRRVMVVGGGNTAMDSCRTALRMGAETVYLVYRRSEAEMPARVEEVRHAKEEGVVFMTLHNPMEYLTDERGVLTGVRLQVMTLGEPDASGRRKPVAVAGEERVIAIDQAIVAVGVSPNPIVGKYVTDIAVSARGTIVVDDSLRTSLPVVYAGGDIVRGGATVVLAIGDGQRAAEEIMTMFKE